MATFNYRVCITVRTVDALHAALDLPYACKIFKDSIACDMSVTFSVTTLEEAMEAVNSVKNPWIVEIYKELVMNDEGEWVYDSDELGDKIFEYVTPEALTMV
jgi:hypothetical protein